VSQESRVTKASDIISDEAFLACVDKYNLEHPEMGGAVSWKMAEALVVPIKVLRAKAASLIRRGVIEGCSCGCRGDFRRVKSDTLGS
jgi:hypothetical protein